MPSYVIESFASGISDFEDRGLPGSFKLAKSADIRKFLDSLTCGQALTDDLAAGTMTGIARFIVPASNGYSYHFCNDGKIYRRSSLGVYTLVYTETNESGNIKGAAEWYDSAGNTYLLWATDTRLNIKRIIGTGYTNTEPWTDVNTVPTGVWPKTNLSAGFNWHTMKNSNGVLLICNGNWMALVGYDMSYTNQALNIIPGNIAQCIIERGLYTVLGGTSSLREESPMFLWDSISLSWNLKKILKIKGINSMIDTELPLMQVGTNGQLFYGDMVNIMPIMAFPGGGTTNPSGVDADGNLALFGVYGATTGFGGIYSYGRKKKNQNFSLNLEYPFDCDEIGSVCKVGTDILFSYKLGTTYGVKKVDTANKAVCTYQSLDLKAPRADQKLANWNRVVLTTTDLPTGTKIECYRRIDKVKDNSVNAAADANGWIKCGLEDGTTQFVTATGREAVFFAGDSGKIFELELILTPLANATPEVLRAEVFFN